MRIGLLGGTFDPPHIGHLIVAQDAWSALRLDRVVFIPAAVPPHKAGRVEASAELRLEMLRAACGDDPRFAIDDLELRRPGPSYTVDTLQALGGETADLVLILSAEAFRELRTWHEPERILELTRLAVVPRDGFPDANRAYLAEHFPGFEDRAIFLSGPRLRLSASELRDRAANGRSLRYLVPDAVAAYIGDHALYSDPIWRKNRP